ncbi:MAG: PorV/PorQ family protein [Bacteroidota bacterium]
MTLKIVLLLGLLVPFSVFAQLETPKYSNEFLTLGVGGRALGMGGAQVGVTNDVTAAYWNPAGLLAMRDKHEIGLMHTSYFGGIANYDYLGFATKLDSSNVIGISAVRLGVDDIPDTRFLIDENGQVNYDNVGSFAEASYAFMFSYARAVPFRLKRKNKADSTTYFQKYRLRLGANAKVIYRTAGIFTEAWGFGLDVGAQLPVGRWQFGLMAKDITGTFNAWSFNTEAVEDVFTATGNEIPTNSVEVTLPRLVLGAARDIELPANLNLITSLSLEATFDGRRNTLIQSDFASISPNLGMELGYQNKVFLRTGLGNFQEIEDFDGTQNWSLQPNFGVGVQLKKFTIDYALTNLGQQLDLPYSHVFSVLISFNNKDIEFLKPKQ